MTRHDTGGLTLSMSSTRRPPRSYQVLENNLAVVNEGQVTVKII